MQLHQSLLILVTLVVTCAGEERTTQIPPLAPVSTAAARPNAAWLGFSVRKPDPAGAAQIPTLPPGVGFVIQAVTPGGPAELAELQPMDVLWKFGDQLLVNQGQLATLLGLGKPGDEVQLAVFRAGKPVAIKITLGEAPAVTSEFSREMIDAAILPDGEEMPRTRIVTMLDRTATYSSSDGKALVRRDGEGYKVVISDPDKKIVFDGVLAADGNLEGIPADWRRRVCVLRRSLDHALESRIVPVRAPRPRVVPPPSPAAGGAPPLAKP
jgi:hypothetical protein